MPTYNKLPKSSPFFQGKWFNKLVEDLRRAGMKKRTVYGYVREIRHLADFHETSPQKLAENDVRVYLLHQIVDVEAASGTQSVILSAIKFFYRITCPRKWKVLEQTKISRVVALPEVITQNQVFEMIDAARTFRLKCFLWITYTLGLRISEAINLQVGDLDSERMMVHIHRGKGAKDRYIPLANSTLHVCRALWSTLEHSPQRDVSVSRRGSQSLRWINVPDPDQHFYRSRGDQTNHPATGIRQESQLPHYPSLPYGVLKFDWVVNIKSVGSGQAVLKYLAPYVYRIAICNNRIESVDDSGVRYKVKPSGETTYQSCRLGGESFVRAFAQHILPPGFKKVRYYGFMSPNCKLQLADARWLVWLWLGWTFCLGSVLAGPSVPERKPPSCPRCRGELRLIGITNSQGQWLWRSLVISRGPPEGRLPAHTGESRLR